MNNKSQFIENSDNKDNSFNRTKEINDYEYLLERLKEIKKKIVLLENNFLFK